MNVSRIATVVDLDGRTVSGRNVGIAEVMSSARQLLVIPPELELAAKSRDAREVLEALERLRELALQELRMLADTPRRRPKAPGAAGAAELAIFIDQLWATARSVRSALESLGEVSRSLSKSSSVEDLLDRTRPVVHAIGFERVGISLFDASRWIIQRAYIEDDPSLSSQILDLDRREPQYLRPDTVEAQVASRQKGMLFANIRSQLDHTHAAVVQALDLTSVLVVPLIFNGKSVGLMHVDFTNVPRPLLGERARSFIAFSQVYNVIFENVFLRESINQIQARLQGWPLEATASSGAASRRSDRSDHDERLTRREHDVMRLMARGLTNEQIARDLFLSPSTVKAHVKHILRKLEVDNRATAIAHYLQR